MCERERERGTHTQKEPEENQPYILRFYHILVALYALSLFVTVTAAATVGTVLGAVCFFS